MAQEKKRPQTLKQRIRSKVWGFLLEDGIPTEIKKIIPSEIDGREIAVALANHDIFQSALETSKKQCLKNSYKN